MLTSAPSLLVPMMLWALLLLPSSLSAHRQRWDDPTCTSGVVSVSRGERAEMSCNMSNPFSLLSICLVVPGEECRLIFNDTAQGHFSQDGWKLRVRGRTAQLVMEEAQDTQAGTYMWMMVGRQRNYANITLNISEPPDLPFALFFFRATSPEILFSTTKATPQPDSRDYTLPIVFFVVLSILGLCFVLSCCRSCCSTETQPSVQVVFQV